MRVLALLIVACLLYEPDSFQVQAAELKCNGKNYNTVCDFVLQIAENVTAFQGAYGNATLDLDRNTALIESLRHNLSSEALNNAAATKEIWTELNAVSTSLEGLLPLRRIRDNLTHIVLQWPILVRKLQDYDDVFPLALPVHIIRKRQTGCTWALTNPCTNNTISINPAYLENLMLNTPRILLATRVTEQVFTDTAHNDAELYARIGRIARGDYSDIKRALNLSAPAAQAAGINTAVEAGDITVINDIRSELSGVKLKGIVEIVLAVCGFVMPILGGIYQFCRRKIDELTSYHSLDELASNIRLIGRRQTRFVNELNDRINEIDGTIIELTESIAELTEAVEKVEEEDGNITVTELLAVLPSVARPTAPISFNLDLPYSPRNVVSSIETNSNSIAPNGRRIRDNAGNDSDCEYDVVTMEDMGPPDEETQGMMLGMEPMTPLVTGRPHTASGSRTSSAMRRPVTPDAKPYFQAMGPLTDVPHQKRRPNLRKKYKTPDMRKLFVIYSTSNCSSQDKVHFPFKTPFNPKSSHDMVIRLFGVLSAEDMVLSESELKDKVEALTLEKTSSRRDRTINDAMPRTYDYKAPEAIADMAFMSYTTVYEKTAGRYLDLKGDFMDGITICPPDVTGYSPGQFTGRAPPNGMTPIVAFVSAGDVYCGAIPLWDTPIAKVYNELTLALADSIVRLVTCSKGPLSKDKETAALRARYRAMMTYSESRESEHVFMPIESLIMGDNLTEEFMEEYGDKVPAPAKPRNPHVVKATVAANKALKRLANEPPTREDDKAIPPRELKKKIINVRGIAAAKANRHRTDAEFASQEFEKKMNETIDVLQKNHVRAAKRYKTKTFADGSKVTSFTRNPAFDESLEDVRKLVDVPV